MNGRKERRKMNRDCNNCIYHTSGMCCKRGCEMTTLEDYRNKVIDEFMGKICEKYTEEEKRGNYKQYCYAIKQELAEIAEQMKGNN